MPIATRDEVVAYLAKVPGARKEWTDALTVAKVSMSVVDTMVKTMMADVESPLRASTDACLSKEIGRINSVFGDVNKRSDGNGRLLVSVTTMLTVGERTRLDAVVGNFCQPKIVPSRRFGATGHAVARAARRCATGVMFTRISSGRIIEVGADVKHWLTDTSNRDPYSTEGWTYKSARPAITKRDLVRMDWSSFSRALRSTWGGVHSEATRGRVELLEDRYADIFMDKKIEDVAIECDYIVSCDANYDIKFSTMPAVMERTGAKGWYGYMNRAKGLTRMTRATQGVLPNMGYNYRVNWETGRIYFRHPECASFGYEHDVWELMRYEENNGYVWHTDKASYVYSKGAETNDEMLFFSVARVVKAIYMVQPSYVDNPLRGMLTVKSVWALGGVKDGVPTEFAPVEYSVDSLAFSKVYEKRMAVDVRGDLAQTIGLVKSTNVRMWINGTPVGADRRIATQLIEATAVAVEVLAAESRARGSKVFKEAMGAYDLVKEKQGWVWAALESIFDLRAVCGTVVGPISRAWGTMRGGLLDAALSPLRNFRVEVTEQPDVIRLPDPPQRLYGNSRIYGVKESSHAVGQKGDFVETVLLPDDNSKKAESSEEVSSDTVLNESEVCSGSKALSGDTQITEVAEQPNSLSWAGSSETREEYKAMEEFVSLERYIRDALHTEIRVDATRLKKAKCKNDTEVLQWCTTRTQHTLVCFKACREVRSLGYKNVEYGAIYDMDADVFHRVRRNGNIPICPVKDGWYYTSNHMKVWNLEEILESIEYAKTYGSRKINRGDLLFTLGVPGAGKTRGMMETIAEGYKTGRTNFLVLSVTVKAKEEAIEFAVEFGIPQSIALHRVRTLDGYLITGKFQASYVYVDEFPMAHAGKIDAAVSIADPVEVRLCGDGRQIPYDPFTTGHPCEHSNFSRGISEKNVKFLNKSHRLSIDACAAWVDVYPSIVSCSCCRPEEKALRTLSWERRGGIDGLKREENVRYHAYTRAEADELKDKLHLKGERDKLKLLKNKGLSTVHEDQGATHDSVVTVRSAADYDKNASRRNPSLYNRLTYVLTDMTRHKRGYRYITVSKEKDMVISRVDCSSHQWRIDAVKNGDNVGLTTITDMLTNKYHMDITSGVTLRESYGYSIKKK